MIVEFIGFISFKGEVLVVLKKSEKEKSKLQERGGATEDKVWQAEKVKFQEKLDETKKEMEELEKLLKEEKENSEKERKKAIRDIEALEYGK